MPTPRISIFGKLPGGRTTRIVISIVVVLACCAGLTTWLLLRSSDDESTVQPLASVPDNICSGMVSPEDVAPLTFLRRGEEITSTEDQAPAPDALSCRIDGGGAPYGRRQRAPFVQLRLDVQPFASAPTAGLWGDYSTTRTDMGSGLIGMADAASAWLIVPCPQGATGDLLARAELFAGDRLAAVWSITDQRTELANLLAGTANVVAQNTGCGQRVPDPSPMAPVRQGITDPPPHNAACEAVVSGGSLVLRSMDVAATPQRSALIDQCHLSKLEMAYAELWFVGFRGPATVFAPTRHDITVDREVLAARTEGTCGTEPVIWTTWVSGTGPGASEAVAAHDRLVDAAVKGQGCVAVDRFVTAGAPATAPSSPG